MNAARSASTSAANAAANFALRVGAPVVDEIDAAILDCLHGDEGRLTSEIAKVIHLTSRSTRTRLARLVERGFVREVGTSPQDPTRQYFLAD